MQPFIHLSQIHSPIHAFVRLLIYFFLYLLVFVCLLIYLLNFYKCLFSDSGGAGIVFVEDGTSEEAERKVSIHWIEKQGSTCNHYYHNSVVLSFLHSFRHPVIHPSMHSGLSLFIFYLFVRFFLFISLLI